MSLISVKAELAFKILKVSNNNNKFYMKKMAIINNGEDKKVKEIKKQMLYWR